jgi:putative endonuclease
MSRERKGVGQEGEQLAADHLTRLGYRIIARNYRCPFGEVDIVARDGTVLAFVEVKSRRSDRYGDPQQAVDHRKQGKLSRIALYYLADQHLSNQPARFDVVAVRLDSKGSRVELIRDAFELAGG